MDDTLGIITLSRSTDYVQQLLSHLAAGASMPDVPTTHVVVNNSNSVDLTATALKGGACVLEPDYNTTFSAGNNLAVRALKGRADWLLLLNDDARPGAFMLPNLWRRREQAHILGALLLHEDGTVNHAGTLVTPKFTDHIGRNDPAEKWEEATAMAVPAVTFAVALIRRTLWDRLGGLDESYRYGWEDTDFCLRALQEGATIRCVRDAVAVHGECGTRPRGGAADGENYRLFQSRWEEKVPAVLAEYRNRVRYMEGV
jgi:GT2 family glycosyltransferase